MRKKGWIKFFNIDDQIWENLKHHLFSFVNSKLNFFSINQFLQIFTVGVRFFPTIRFFTRITFLSYKIPSCQLFTNFVLPRQLRRAPRPVYASCPRGSSDEDEPPVALEHDLPVVPDLPHVRAILVQAHAAHQKNFPVLYKTGKGTEHWKKRRRSIFNLLHWRWT